MSAIRSPRREGSRRLSVLVAVLLLGAFAAACGGGGGGGGGGGTPPPPTDPTGITFSASGATGPAVVLATGPASTTSVLELEVRAQSISDLYGVSFELTYPTAVLDFEAFSEGEHLSGGGVETTLQVYESRPGRIVVGLTRLGDVGGTGGSGELLTLRFPGAAAGSGAIGFVDGQAYGPSGASLDGVSFAGGTVQVRL